MAELFERRGEGRQPSQRPGLRDLAVDEEGLFEARLVVERVEFLRHVARLGRRHRHALAGVPDCVGEQQAEGQTPAEVAGDAVGQRPAADRAGDRQGRVGPAFGDRLVALVAVALDGREAAGRAAGLDRPTTPFGPRISQKPSPPSPFMCG